MSELVLEFRDVEKAYGGLRPLRLRRLAVMRGQNIALIGFDATAAEAFVNLATGAAVPEKGEVRAFGAATSLVKDADAWLATLDRFGIVSERTVLLDGFSVLQNLAIPMTLDLDPLPDTVSREAQRLAMEVGVDRDAWAQPVGALSPAVRGRVLLGRALALKPLVLLAEHPNALLPGPDVPAFAADFVKVVAARGLACITLTADPTFAAAVAEDVLTLEPATGELRAAAGWRRWFTRR